MSIGESAMTTVETMGLILGAGLTASGLAFLFFRWRACADYDDDPRRLQMPDANFQIDPRFPRLRAFAELPLDPGILKGAPAEYVKWSNRSAAASLMFFAIGAVYMPRVDPNPVALVSAVLTTAMVIPFVMYLFRISK
jgi:hypothetical protein